jgi:LysR family transcriptional regulator, carnitine catabolism transcriptional activator
MSINVTLRQLEAFLAVARTLNFSAAAAQVHLSQPALSAAIKKLEDTVGAKLFDRDTRNVALTPVGKEMLGVADRLLTDFDGAFEGVLAFLGGKRGRLAVACAPSVAAGFLPEVVAAFQRSHPDVALQVSDRVSDECLALLRDGKVDLALVPKEKDDPEFEYRELFRDQMVLVCRADHALAARKTVTWRSLLPYSHIAFRPSGAVRHLVEAAFAGLNAKLRPVFEVDQVGTMVGFTANGLGVCVLPYSLVQQLRLEPLVFRRILSPELRRSICLTTLKSRTPSPAAEAFSRACIAQDKRNRGLTPIISPASAAGRPARSS